MKAAENKKLEYEALQEFVGLVCTEGSISSQVKRVIKEELTERQEEVIRLYYLEGMKMTGIADRLGICPSTVSRTLKRGRGRIRKYLKYNGRYIVREIED